MKAAKRLFTAANVEAGLSMLGFASSSAFWLLLAFVMGADDYGRLMTVQAAVLLVVSALTFRTHDLFFYLNARHGTSAERAYYLARVAENVAAIVSGVIVTTAAVVYFSDRGRLDAPSVLLVSGYGLLAIVGANQGAAIARLRQLGHGATIARTDAIASVCWLMAGALAGIANDCFWLALLPLGALAPFFRTLLLVRAARRLSCARPGPRPRREEIRLIGLYLTGAQATNFLKNGAVAIETIVLAAFSSPAIVAMYRVARAVQGLAIAGLNVAYQRAYPILARARAPEEFDQAVSDLERRSLAICLVTYPPAAAIALAYAWLKPDISVAALQLLTLGTFLAAVPSALQQPSFALLSLRADHRGVNQAYFLWFGVVLLGTVALLLVPRVEVFMTALIFAGFVRLWHLRRRARTTAGNRMSNKAGPGAAAMPGRTESSPLFTNNASAASPSATDE